MQLVKFNSSDIITTANDKMHKTGVRLMRISEFKKAKGLKGNEATVAYNKYVLENGAVSGAAVAAELIAGRILLTGADCYDSGKGVLRFVRKDSIKDPVAKEPKAIDVEAIDYGKLSPEALAIMAAKVEAAKAAK
jgi:hypothetical protein